jgi:uncharacterized protein YbjT (DUF2867 family)
MIRNALIAGATGLVGNELVSILVKSEFYNSLHVLSRRPYSVEHRKIASHTVDFSDLKNFDPGATIHDVYICLGTTIKKAGNKENFLKVDSYYVLETARWAKQNNVERLAFISSMGANTRSKTFYLATKGKVENDLAKLKIPHLVILRPSLLLGNRNEFRLGESIGKIIFTLLNPFLLGRLKRFRAVSARLVSYAMFHYTTQSETPVLFYENEQILDLAKDIK